MYIVNKLHRKDNPDKLDAYFVTEVVDCAKRIVHTTFTSDRHINNSDSPLILIPFGAYSDYSVWKNNPTGGYTLSVGDFIFEDDPGEVTPDNLAEKANSMACYEVKTFFVADKSPMVALNYQIKVYA